jgi:GPH family glycoside/pentoside/hexuronide:cation symporter
VREKFIPSEEETISLTETLRVTWKNIPFRYAAGIYMFNWSAVDMIIIAFPYFLLYWVSEGDPLLKVPLLGVNFSIESAFFGITLVICIIFAPFWQWFSRMFNKKVAYMCGMATWVIVQALIFTIQPGEVTYLLVIAALAGIGISAAYIIPDSMLPDVIEWDELHTGKRQEGIYYGIRTLIRKMTGALVSFLTLQVLGWSGYHRPENGLPFLDQPESAMLMIRLMASIFGAIILIGTIVVAWYYPLSREKYDRVAHLLEIKRARKTELP